MGVQHRRYHGPMDVCTNPVTLEFDDETLEAELKSKVLNLPIVRAGVVMSLLLLLSLELAGYGRSPLHFVPVFLMWLCAYIVVCAPEYVTRRLPEAWNAILNNRSEAHNQLCIFCSAAWVVCMANWWRMVLDGSLPRIRPEEHEKVLACCAMWLVCAVSMHVLHFPFNIRGVVLASAMPIILSSDIKQPLLLALMGGELMGYVLESVIRANFLERADQVERLKQEKERVVYELNMTRHRQEAVLRQQQQVWWPTGGSWRHSTASTSQDDSTVGLDSAPPHTGTAPPHIGAAPMAPHARSDARPTAESTTSYGSNSEVAHASWNIDAPQLALGAAEVAAGVGFRPLVVRDTSEAHAPTVTPEPPLLSLERADALWRTLEDVGLEINDVDNISNCS